MQSTFINHSGRSKSCPFRGNREIIYIGILMIIFIIFIILYPIMLNEINFFRKKKQRDVTISIKNIQNVVKIIKQSLFLFRSDVLY